MQITGVTAAGAVRNTYASIADTGNGDVNVRATSAEEAAHPYVPHGLNVRVKLKVSYSRHTQLSHPSADGDVNLTKTVNVTAPAQYDVFGIPMLSPAYSFGLRPEPLIEKQQQSAAPGLRTIASVTAVARNYAVTYDGEDEVDGAPCYVISLTPLRKPAFFRLRKLWVDELTFETHQALLQGNFTQGPGPSLPWLVRFTQVDGATYIKDETSTKPVRYFGRTYSSVTIAFENIQPTAAPGALWALPLDAP